VRLHVAPLQPGVILQPAPDGVERVAQRDVGILVVVPVDDDLVVGHVHDHAHVEPVSLLVMSPLLLDCHRAADDVGVELFQLRRLAADPRVERVGGRHVAHRDFQRYLHGTSALIRFVSRTAVTRPTHPRPALFTLRGGGRMRLTGVKNVARRRQRQLRDFLGTL